MTIEQSYQSVQRRLHAAAERAGRAWEEIRLVAVSKKQPLEKIQAVAEMGHQLFGENRVQELREKVPLLPGRLTWHLIGHLQKNKIRQVLPLVTMIESVDSLELARQIDRIAGELGLTPQILLEVNLAGEASKYGFAPRDLPACLEELLGLAHLEIRGVMAIPPMVEEAEQARPFFVQLRELRDRLQNAAGVPFPELSMGMSADFEIAIEEGATMVRVGSALFGPRS